MMDVAIGRGYSARSRTSESAQDALVAAELTQTVSRITSFATRRDDGKLRARKSRRAVSDGEARAAKGCRQLAGAGQR